MTRLVFSEGMLGDIDRLVSFLMEQDISAALCTFDIINHGLQLLKQHPEIGRMVEGDKRELVISRGNTGYIALYYFDPIEDIAVVLAVRHQREDGFE